MPSAVVSSATRPVLVAHKGGAANSRQSRDKKGKSDAEFKRELCIDLLYRLDHQRRPQWFESEKKAKARLTKLIKYQLIGTRIKGDLSRQRMAARTRDFAVGNGLLEYVQCGGMPVKVTFKVTAAGRRWLQEQKELDRSNCIANHPASGTIRTVAVVKD